MPEYEGYVKLADDTVISLQCHEGRCRECPDETPDDQNWTARAC